MSERELATACGLEGLYRIVVDVAPGSDAQRVMVDWTTALRYGGLVAYGRRNHSSDKALPARSGLNGLSIAFPVVFVSLSTFMIAGTLARAVHVQRAQIAQLKALGYSALQVGAHYLKFAVVIVLAGLLAGAVGESGLVPMSFPSTISFSGSPLFHSIPTTPPWVSRLELVWLRHLLA
jgi:putative ABC transport system permease protein